MSLSKNEPRRYRRPPDAAVASVSPRRPGRPAAGPVDAEDEAEERPQRPDPAREALLGVLAIRGRPIDRRRGMRPSEAFRRAAWEYIISHHDNYCHQYARSRSARHVRLEDLVQACYLGAYIALERYDKDHEEAYRFLSYAKNWLWCETNRLLHREESLVGAPEKLRKVRARLAKVFAEVGDEVAEVTDEELSEILGSPLCDVREARSAHLGHEHRVVDERSKVCRRGLAELRAGHDARAREMADHAGIDGALATLDPLLRQVLWLDYGVGEDQGVPPPRTPQAHRSIRHLALRRVREELEG